MRELPDCVTDSRALLSDLADSLETRMGKCIQPMLYKLKAAFDIPLMFDALCGHYSFTRNCTVLTKGRAFYEDLGKEEFREFFEYLRS